MTAQDQLTGVAMRELARRHAALLREMGPVMVLHFDPCPNCMGRVLASETVARCLSCGWRYHAGSEVEPVASRRADP